MQVECINDKDWNPEVVPFIKEFPVKGNIYTVVKRNHTAIAGMGYVLEELNNPPLPDGTPVGFSVKRFKPVDEVDLTELAECLSAKRSNMTEQITTPVKFTERLQQTTEACQPMGFLKNLTEYIAEQVELAYIAGQNGYRAGTFRTEVRDTGEVKVAAVNYTKFKGFRL